MTGVLLALAAAMLPVFLIRGFLMFRDPGGVASEGGRLLGSAQEEQLSPFRAAEARLAAGPGRKLAARLDPSAITWLDRRLDYAGRPDGDTVESLLAAQLLWGFLGLLLGLTSYVALGSVVILVAVVLGMLVVPGANLISEGRSRQARMERELPEFLDVLAVVMRAGLSYRAALHRVTNELSGPVSAELREALGEMELGSSRRDAFSRIQRRTSAPGLHRFIVAQTQAEELGVPLAEAINSLAKEMRRRYDQALRRWAARQASIIDLFNVSFMLIGCVVAVVVMILYGGGLLGEGGVFSNGLGGLTQLGGG